MEYLALALAIVLYLFIGFAVALIHYLGSTRNDPPSGLKAVFLAPYIGAVWILKKVSK
jgi:hypothetical protein